MSNVLAALFGGLGAGASSYGGNLMREQEQQRRDAQRMAELQQQEASRKALAQEQSALKIEQDKAKRAASVASIRTLFPNEKLPEGDNWDADAVLDALKMRDQNTRFLQGQQGMEDRLVRKLGGRMDEIAAQGDINKTIAAMGNDTRKTIAAMMEKGRNARSGDSGATIEDFYTKFLTQPDDNGFRRTPAQAMKDAQEALRVLQGASAPQGAAPRPQQANPAEQDLMVKAQRKIQSIMADPSLSPEDKQDMVQQVNDILRSRVGGMRGGR